MHHPRFVSIIYPTLISLFLFSIPIFMSLFVIHGLWQDTIIVAPKAFLSHAVWLWIAAEIVLGTLVQWAVLWMAAFMMFARARAAWHDYWDSLVDTEPYSNL